MSDQIIIYSSYNCGYCDLAKKLLDKKKIKYQEINIQDDPSQRDIMLERANGKRTVPQIFFNDTATTEIYTILFVGSVRCV